MSLDRFERGTYYTDNEIFSIRHNAEVWGMNTTLFVSGDLRQYQSMHVVNSVGMYIGLYVGKAKVERKRPLYYKIRLTTRSGELFILMVNNIKVMGQKINKLPNVLHHIDLREKHYLHAMNKRGELTYTSLDSNIPDRLHEREMQER